MPTTSYWLEDDRSAVPRGTRVDTPDVIVVGGGVTGCSCALTLAQRGIRVQLREAREIAGGASGRNGGFALRGAAMPYDVARDAYGREPARRLMALTERTLDRLEALAGDAFRRVGSLRLAFGSAERDALRREHDALREDGFAVEWLDELPPPLDRLYAGALLHPPDGVLHPARWVRRLAAHAVEAGADVRVGSPVELSALDADAVVVATDGFTATLLPELADVVVPTRGQVLVTEPVTPLRYARPHYARDGYDYWHQRPDGRLVIGGSRDAAFEEERTGVEATTPVVQDRIEALAAELLDARPRITHRWAGIWGTTPDQLPLVGPVAGRDRVWIAAGYSGHGNVPGLACGDLVARALLGDDVPDHELFDPARPSLRRDVWEESAAG
ncbi:MAG TPA: FAD-binding oxidoreductase [Gaiellaceae bacterium]|nr:FAD-binding oxidoreductase [Gaiellaceae bacterium]